MNKKEEKEKTKDVRANEAFKHLTFNLSSIQMWADTTSCQVARLREEFPEGITNDVALNILEAMAEKTEEMGQEMKEYFTIGIKDVRAWLKSEGN